MLSMSLQCKHIYFFLFYSCKNDVTTAKYFFTCQKSNVFLTLFDNTVPLLHSNPNHCFQSCLLDYCPFPQSYIYLNSSHASQGPAPHCIGKGLLGDVALGGMSTLSGTELPTAPKAFSCYWHKVKEKKIILGHVVEELCYYSRSPP